MQLNSILMSLGVALAVLSLACDDKDGKQSQYALGPICTSDALELCLETEPGVFETELVGRKPSECEFEARPNAVDPVNCDYCIQEEFDLGTALDATNYCEIDADCRFDWYPFATCSFGCGQLYHADEDLTLLFERVETFAASGCNERCAVDCAPTPTAEQLRCVEQVCTIVPVGTP